MCVMMYRFASICVVIGLVAGCGAKREVRVGWGAKKLDVEGREQVVQALLGVAEEEVVRTQRMARGPKAPRAEWEGLRSDLEQVELMLGAGEWAKEYGRMAEFAAMDVRPWAERHVGSRQWEVGSEVAGSALSLARAAKWYALAGKEADVRRVVAMVRTYQPERWQDGRIQAWIVVARLEAIATGEGVEAMQRELRGVEPKVLQMMAMAVMSERVGEVSREKESEMLNEVEREAKKVGGRNGAVLAAYVMWRHREAGRLERVRKMEGMDEIKPWEERDWELDGVLRAWVREGAWEKIMAETTPKKGYLGASQASAVAYWAVREAREGDRERVARDVVGRYGEGLARGYAAVGAVEGLVGRRGPAVRLARIIDEMEFPVSNVR